MTHFNVSSQQIETLLYHDLFIELKARDYAVSNLVA